MLTRRRILKRLAKMHAAVDYLKSKRLVRNLRFLVADQCVRRHLAAAMLAAPFLGGLHELPAYAAAASFLAHEPTLNKSNWMRRIATVRMRAQSHFQKAGQLPICILRNKNRRGQRSAHSCPEQGISFTELFPD